MIFQLKMHRKDFDGQPLILELDSWGGAPEDDCVLFSLGYCDPLVSP